jgi:hypothetical protein
LARQYATEAEKQEDIAADAEDHIYGDPEEQAAEDAQDAASMAAEAAANAADRAETAADAAEEASNEASDTKDTAAQNATEIKEKERSKGPFGECGYTDWGCSFGNWLYWSTYDLLTSLGAWMMDIVFIQKNFARNDVVKGFQADFVSLAWTFLMLFFTFQLVRILSSMVLQEDFSELKALIRKLVVVAALIPSSLWICQELFDLGNNFSNHFIQQELKKLPEKIQNLSAVSQIGNVVLLLVLLIVLAVVLVSISFQMIIRQAEFVFYVVIGPLAIVTMVNKEMNLFSRWWRNLLAVVFTQSIQVLMLVISFKLVTQTDLTGLTTSIGFLVLTMRAPQIVNEWLGSSSLAGSEAGGLQSTVTSVGKKAGKSVVALFKGAK